MSRHLSIDIETYSSVDITKSGLYKYVQSDDFEVLLFAYSVDGGDVNIIDLACGESLPEEIVQAVFDPNVQNHAYNAAFEWYCLSKYFQIEPLSWLSQWRCTQLHGLYCGYTAGLAATGEALGLPQEKRKLATGKALIRTFCTPHTPNARNPTTRVLSRHEPEKWRLFREYCKQDVVTEMAIERRLSAFPVPEQVQREWELDQRINAAGIRLDMDLIDGALHIAGAVTSDLMQEAVTLTGLENPNAVGQLKGWVETQTGLTVESLDKETVKELLARSELPAKVRRVLEIRQELGKSSVKKYEAMVKSVCKDGRVRGLLQFYGANRTGRWAGRLVQAQNLPRNYIEELDLARDMVKGRDTEMIALTFGNVPDTLSQLIRTAFVPAKGCKFVVADFSAIEARVIAWLAKETWRQEVFRTHGRIYEASASAMIGVPIEKGQSGIRTAAKGKDRRTGIGVRRLRRCSDQHGSLKNGVV
jgi:DNA polymerase